MERKVRGATNFTALAVIMTCTSASSFFSSANTLKIIKISILIKSQSQSLKTNLFLNFCAKHQIFAKNSCKRISLIATVTTFSSREFILGSIMLETLSFFSLSKSSVVLAFLP